MQAQFAGISAYRWEARASPARSFPIGFALHLPHVEHVFFAFAIPFFRNYFRLKSGMLRKTPLTQDDLAVSRRLVRLRKTHGLSREDWAKKSGVTVGIITRVELTRMPLRYEDARLLLPALIEGDRRNIIQVSPYWLAFGIGPEMVEWPLFLPPAHELGLPENITFSEFAAMTRPVLDGFAHNNPRQDLPERWLTPCFNHWVLLIERVSRIKTGVEKVGSLLARSAEKLAPFSDRAVMLLETYNRFKAQEPFNSSVDNIPQVRKYPGMPSQVKSLMERIRTATSQHGAKRQLCERLKIRQSRLSEWITGMHEPNAETALQLLVWVQAEEAKQKSPGSVGAPPGPKTRKPKSMDEKSNRVKKR